MSHKCFISFKKEDATYKDEIVKKLRWEDVIVKSLDRWIDSENDDYIMSQIRKDYLGDSTVTVFIVGGHSSELEGEDELNRDKNHFIKRELQASLYNGEPPNTRNGILGVVLPAVQERIFKGLYTCPKCGKVHLEPFLTTYKRNIIFRIENVLVKIKITVPRVKCSNCNSTHALLPDFCIPLKQYSNQAVLSIASEAGKTSTENVATKLNIDSKQVRRFVNIVKSNMNNILLIHTKQETSFKSKIDCNSSVNVIIESLPENFTEIFFEEYSYVFLYVKNKRELYMQFKKLLS